MREAAHLTAQQHLFASLYLVLALEHGATLVTAGHRFVAAAQKQGHITLLSDFDACA